MPEFDRTANVSDPEVSPGPAKTENENERYADDEDSYELLADDDE